MVHQAHFGETKIPTPGKGLRDVWGPLLFSIHSLAQANDLAMQGKLQSEIARTLGVSIMTLHRWRKAPPGLQPALVAPLALEVEQTLEQSRPPLQLIDPEPRPPA